ncbi:MAG: hypothetical protein K0S07_1219 [Chlamydiales bacterium]|jgi:hypothetical protein|nr:hypothetical protein [Chlamydiales bacterium]
MRSLYFTLLILFLSVSCQKSALKEGLSARVNLEEVDLLIGQREFTKAIDKANESLKAIDAILAKNSEEKDYQLLFVKAHLLLFSAKNTGIIENAPIQPKNFVRLPALSDYIDYEKDVLPALAILTRLSQEKLPLSQQVFVATSIAFIKRLDLQTANEAIDAYNQALAHLEVLAVEKKEGKGGAPSLLDIQQEIQSIKAQQVEVYLLQNAFQEALGRLEELAAGKDLLYFSNRFRLLEDKIYEIRSHLHQEAPPLDDDRSEQTKLRQENPYRLEFRHLQQELVNLQNNLLYRLICYKQLQQKEEFKQGQEILKSFYPELNEELEALFQRP